jgi:TonB family protein
MTDRVKLMALGATTAAGGLLGVASASIDLRGALAARLGQGLLGWVGPMTVATGAILIAAWLADRALERRVAASARLFLYVGVLARLALPVDWHNPLGLLGRRGPVAAAVLAGDGPGVATLVATDLSARGPGAAGWAALAYLTVVLLLLARWIHQRLSLRRRLRACRPLGMGGSADVPVWRHEELGPFVAGLLRPRIVVPESLVNGAEPDALGWVLRHETAHVQRRDPLSTALVQIACILAWPILPVWIAARRIRALMEVACDEVAIRGADGPGRRRYGEVLVALAVALPPPRALHAALRFGSPLRGRLRALIRWPRWPAPLQGAVVAALVAVVVACAGEPPPPSEETPVEQSLRMAVAESPSTAGDPAFSRRPPQPVLTITREGDLYLFRNKIQPDQLVRKVSEALRASGANTVLLRGDKAVMMDAAVDLMRKLKLAGVRNVGILTPHQQEAETARDRMEVQVEPTSGPLDVAAIKRIYTANHPQAQACYEQRRATRPDLRGQAMVKLTIGRTGEVASAVLVRSTLADHPLEDCLVSAVRGWRFPPPAGEALITYKFDFRFEPPPAP